MDALPCFIIYNIGRTGFRRSLSAHKKSGQGAGRLYVLAYVLGRHRNTRTFIQWPLLLSVGLCALNCMHSHTSTKIQSTNTQHKVRNFQDFLVLILDIYYYNAFYCMSYIPVNSWQIHFIFHYLIVKVASQTCNTLPTTLGRKHLTIPEFMSVVICIS